MWRNHIQQYVFTIEIFSVKQLDQSDGREILLFLRIFRQLYMSSHFSLFIMTISESVLQKQKLHACLFSKAFLNDMFKSSARFFLRHYMRRRCKYLINTAFMKIVSFFHILFFWRSFPLILISSLSALLFVSLFYLQYHCYILEI